MSLKITVYRNVITWSYVDGFESLTQGHLNLHTGEDVHAIVGDIINEIQEREGVVGLEIDSKDIAI